MAGGSHIIWVPLLLLCLFQASDNQHVISSKGDLDVPDVILSRLKTLLPDGFDHINVTTFVWKTCTGVQDQLTLMNKQLNDAKTQNRQLDQEVSGLRKNVRLCELQLAGCSSTFTVVSGCNSEQQNKLKQLLNTYDTDTFLILKYLQLNSEVSTLQNKIKLATVNSTETSAAIKSLQKEVQEKLKELNAKRQLIEGRNTNSALIFEIISLQNQIWDLGEKESRTGESSESTEETIKVLQQQLNKKIRDLQSQGDATSDTLELISVHSKLEVTNRLINAYIQRSRTNVADYQKQLKKLGELLRQKILQLTNNENDQQLTQEIQEIQIKMEALTRSIAITKATTESQLKELRGIWESEKKKQELLLKKNEESDYAQAQTIFKIIVLMKELRDALIDETPTSNQETLQILVQKYATAQAEIKKLQEDLKSKNEEFSVLQKEYTEVKTELDLKITELNRSGDSKTALILTVINLQIEISALRDLIATEDSGKTSELQKQLEEKQEQLRLKTTEIERLIANPRIILSITELQDEIHDVQRFPANETTINHLKGLQTRMNGLISEIEDGKTQLLFRILTLQSQVRYLQTRLSDLDKLRISEVNQLRNDLKTKTKELKKYTDELKETNQTRANLILKITDLQNQLIVLKEKIRNDNTAHSSTVRQLQEELNTRRLEHARDQNEISKLKTELQIQSEKCSGLMETYTETKTKLEKMTEELKRRGESKASLILNMFNLQGELITLKDLIATTKQKNPDSISGDSLTKLQKQLEEKQDELNSKTEELQRMVTNPKIFFEIIQLQNVIWDLQKKDTDGSSQKRVEDLQNKIDDLISEIESKDDEYLKLVLQIISLKSQAKQLQGLLFHNKALTNAEITELMNDLITTKKLLQKYTNELNKSNQTNAILVLRITDLTTHLRNLDVEGQERGNTTSAIINDLKEQLRMKEREHFQNLATIKALYDKLNQTDSQCNSLEQQLQTLQAELDNKVTKLLSQSNSVTSLAVQISTLNMQLEEAKRQLENTGLHSKIKELQKIIDEKTKEIAEKTKELKERSPQAQRFLQIFTIQNVIEKYINVAGNETTYEEIKSLEDQVNHLIEGIQDENNEHTKLIFKFLSQQDEITRLKKLEEAQTKAYDKHIESLQNELKDIRNEISEKSDLLKKGDHRISELSDQIMELHKKIKPLEDEIADLKKTNAESLKDLQKRLNLREKQLQDSELQLSDTNAKNYEYIKEIGDLRVQLRKAQKSKDKVKALDETVETQQKQITKLENANRDLKREINDLTISCQGDCEEVKSQLQQTLKEVTSLRQQLQSKNRELNQLQEKLGDATRLSKALQEENNNLEEQFQQSQALNDHLQKQLSDKDTVINKQQQELDERTTEYDKLQDENNNLQAENNRLEKTVEKLQNNLSDKEDKTIYPRKMTFDPSTAHPRIILSGGNTKMSTAEELQNVPDNPGRFDKDLAALGSTGYSRGRQYWEVSVDGKICYHIGMASKSAQRKGNVNHNPTNGYWTIVLNKQGQLKALDRRHVVIPVQTQPLILGILLDYKNGQISFYDAGTRSHVYSFAGQTFTDEIFPFVNFCVEEAGNQTPIVLLTPGSVDWIK